MKGIGLRPGSAHRLWVTIHENGRFPDYIPRAPLRAVSFMGHVSSRIVEILTRLAKNGMRAFPRYMAMVCVNRGGIEEASRFLADCHGFCDEVSRFYSTEREGHLCVISKKGQAIHLLHSGANDLSFLSVLVEKHCPKWLRVTNREIALRTFFQGLHFPDKKGDFFADLRTLNHEYRAELAIHVAKALNLFLKDQNPEGYEAKKILALEVNTILRDFGLAIWRDKGPCILRAGTQGRDGLFCLEPQTTSRPRVRISNSAKLSDLLPFDLVEESRRKVRGQGQLSSR